MDFSISADILLKAEVLFAKELYDETISLIEKNIK